MKMNDLGEYKYFVCNTKEQWIENNYPLSASPSTFPAPSTNNEAIFDIRLDGISLKSLNDFVHSETIVLGIPKVIDLTLDSSGAMFYGIDAQTKRIILFDLNSNAEGGNNYYQVNCIKFLQPKSIRAGKKNLYVIDDNRIYLIAKINYQIRCFFEIGKVPTYLALDSDENIFIFDSMEKQIYKIHSNNMRLTALFSDNEKNLILSELSPSSPNDDNGDASITIIDLSIGKHNEKIYLLTSISILIFNSIGKFENKITFKDIQGFKPSSIYVDSINNIYVSNSRDSEFRSPIKIDNTKNIIPIAFNGPSQKILLNKSEDTLFILNNEDGQIDLLKLRNLFLSNGVFVFKPFDSLQQNLEWHRISLETVIPSNAFLELYYYASNSESFSPSDDQWKKSPPNPRDLLLNNAIGRYLWIKIALYTSDEFNSPIIKGIKVFYPRQSYLKYLPSIYQEDEESKIFLERYLSLYETLFLSIEEKIDNFSQYLDPNIIPEDFLPWISSWLSFAYDETFPKGNFRKFILRASDIYLKRGTREGLLEMMNIFLDDDDDVADGNLPFYHDNVQKVKDFRVMIFEEFQLDCIKDNPEYVKLYCKDPYSFCVLLNPFFVNDKGATMVKKIIKNEKPAHTIGHVKLLQPWFYLGMHTYLNINTCLSDQVFILGHSALSRDTKMDTYEDSGQIDIRSRLGKDTLLT